MQGVQTFPTPLNSHSLDEIKELNRKYSKYNVKVGFADHISGNLPEAIYLPLMAFASGACIVENHFTIDRRLKWEDYESALDIKNFNILTNQSKKLSKLLLKTI